MPRFYLNLEDGVSVPDREGEDLADVEAATAAAIKGAREIMAEEVKKGRLPLGDSIHVSDDEGAQVAVIRFADAIEIEHPSEAHDREG